MTTSERNSSAGVAAVPDDAHRELLTDESEVQFKMAPVLQRETMAGEKQLRRDPLDNAGQLVRFEERQPTKEFVGLTKEVSIGVENESLIFVFIFKELKSYINDPRWKRIRWAIALLYVGILALLLIGSILLISTSPSCPPKTKLVWHEQEIIYELDVRSFRDANADGIGDMQGERSTRSLSLSDPLFRSGFMKELPYLEKNGFKSVLFQSSIFNTASTNDARPSPPDLHTIDSSLGTNMDLENITKILHRKGLSSTSSAPVDDDQCSC